MAALKLNRTHRILIGIVILGAVVIATIGFAGSYAAVRELAEDKGFGRFAVFFPIGIDAGIMVLLALDLLLTWIRIPFPLLRQTAWLLTAATIAFNGAAAWPDPLGVAMHAIIPVLFVISVEAARHAIGRIADITADKHMEGVRLSRWLLAFPSTFLLWRRMKLWELRSYDEVIRLEQDRLVYRARLRAKYGRAWRRKAPIESTMPLKLAKYGVPLSETAPAGLSAAGIAPAGPDVSAVGAIPAQRRSREQQALAASAGPRADAEPAPAPAAAPAPEPAPEPAPAPPATYAEYEPAQQVPQQPSIMVPTGTGTGLRTLGQAPVNGNGHRPAPPQLFMEPPTQPVPEPEPEPLFDQFAQEDPADDDADVRGSLPDDIPREDAYYGAFLRFVQEKADFPNARQFALYLLDHYGVGGRTGGPLTEGYLRGYVREFRQRYNEEQSS
ncbi:DUF2637 domain-containing protein [Streptomyces boninensis]|uniref:DUF2637 domain-containing protein n=1 Tax=Streptomyces boninensis TaxID=2039455 RepID=UPI003B22191B